MPIHIASHRRSIAPGATKNFAIDCTGKLRGAEVLTGTPTVTEITTADLTISNQAKNTVIEECNDRLAGVGQLIKFTASGAVLGTLYEIDAESSTDSSPAQTIRGKIYIKCEKQVAGQHEKAVSESRIIAVDFGREMRSGELITGTPTVSVVSGSGLTVANVQKNSQSMEINGREVAVDEAVLFTAEDGTADVTYELLVTGSTDAGQVLPQTIYLTVVAD